MDLARFLLSLLLASTCMACVLAQGDGPIPVPYSTPELCGVTQYFQSGNLSCLECGENRLPTEEGELFPDEALVEGSVDLHYL